MLCRVTRALAPVIILGVRVLEVKLDFLSVGVSFLGKLLGASDRCLHAYRIVVV